MAVLTTIPTRSLTAFPIALMITLGLLYLMTTFISITDNMDSPPAFNTVNIDAIFEKDIPKEEVVKKRPKKPPEVKSPPPGSHTIATQTDVVTDHVFDPKTFHSDMTTAVTVDPTALGVNVDGPAIPVTQMAAIYPERAKRRGLEGYVDIAFDITVDGTTENVRVIDSNPVRTFDREALRAVKKWKYRPERVDGKPMPVKNVHTRVRFTMEK